MPPHESDGQPTEASAWWWRGSTRHSPMRAVTCSETELLSAAVLSAALCATKTAPSIVDPLVNARAARELEMHVRKSPLPHSLQLPVLEFTTDYVLVEAEGAVICAIHATKPSDSIQAVVGLAVPLSQPYVHHFGGARVHAPFWKRAQKLELSTVYQQARERDKVLLLCGHSIGGSIAKLVFCKLVYSGLPTSMRMQLEKIDKEQPKLDKKDHEHKNKHFWKDSKKKREDHAGWLRDAPDKDRAAAFQDLPVAMAVGFGAPYVGNDELSTFLEVLGMHDRVITFVNEFDCIPSILNIAHSAAMLAKTTERLVTIAKATKALLNLLPAPMQQKIIDLTAAAGTASVPSAASAYLSMSITMLQKSFEKLREFNIVKVTDYRYAPCGNYVIMKKENAEFSIFSDAAQIRKALGEDEEEATSSLTGNSILQHVMSAYVDAITRRSRSIQINATMNHYERLGVARNATDREIRRSYRSLALRWHPDRIAHGSLTNQQKEVAEDIFKLLAESYEVLSNSESRRTYDAYLNRPPSRREEFMHYGTVDGVTLDEAISIFSDAVENFSSTLHRVAGRLTSSSSTTVGHPLQHNGGKLPATSASTCNHHGTHTTSVDISISSDGISAGLPQLSDTSSTQMTTTVSAVPEGTSNLVSSSEVSTSLSKTGEVFTSNKADASAQAISTRSSSDSVSSRSTSASLKTVSVVGGAVAVAASVAIIVSAWSQFSEASRKKRQAAAVRDMSGDCLVLLLEDHRNVEQRQIRTPSIEQLQLSRARQIKAYAIASTPACSESSAVEGSELQLAKEAQQALIELTQEDREKDQDDILIDEFFECAAQDEEATVEAMAEEEFFDCVELVQDVDQHFGKTRDKILHPLGKVHETAVFPRGSKVNTPFGLGVIEEWRENTATAAVRFETQELRHIDKADITRGASMSFQLVVSRTEERRTELAERVIVSYGLEDQNTGDQIANVALAGAEGAVDSGLRAAGGLALANGVARSGTALGGMVAAPLAVASILVDIGKEFYDYRKKHSERKSLGVLSSTSERLMRREFRLKTGEVVVSRTTAAAGAGLGAYGVASAMTMWAAAGVATGPIGIVAATSAAVVGGVAGYFGGSKVYSLSTASYFKSQNHAKEHIDRLELGARVLFEEHDPTGSGEISKEACLSIMQKLYEISGDTSDFAYEATVEAIKDPSFEGPVTWRMFWIWVSTEAARSLKTLDTVELEASSNAEGERKRDKVRRKLKEAKEKHESKKKRKTATSSEAEEIKGVEEEIHARAAFAPVLPGEDDSLDTVKAAVETLVQNHHLTTGQAFSLYAHLDSNDLAEQVTAREIISALKVELLGTESENNDSDILFPSAKSDAGCLERIEERAVISVDAQPTALTSVPPSINSSKESKKKGLKAPQVDPRLDVMCSLLSTEGLAQFLESQSIIPENTNMARHEDLHCLALASAIPPASANQAKEKSDDTGEE